MNTTPQWLTTVFFGTGSIIDLKIAIWARLADQHVPGVPPPPPSQDCVYYLTQFYMGSEDCTWVFEATHLVWSQLAFLKLLDTSSDSKIYSYYCCSIPKACQELSPPHLCSIFLHRQNHSFSTWQKHQSKLGESHHFPSDWCLLLWRSIWQH